MFVNKHYYLGGNSAESFDSNSQVNFTRKIQDLEKMSYDQMLYEYFCSIFIGSFNVIVHDFSN